jgi:glycosyltransferase involved in cell wall biosynthesis
MPYLLWINQFALLPADGGGTRHFELGRELVRHGWDVTILASDLHLHRREFTRRNSVSDRKTLIEVQDGVEVRWLWAAPYQGNDWRRARNWLTFHRSVAREGKRLARRPDVVIGSSPQIFAASAARSLARSVKCRFVFEVRDLWPESLLAAGGHRGAAYFLLGHVARGLYRDADRVLVLAKGAGEYLTGKGVSAGKIVHVPNGVDINVVRPMLRESATQLHGGEAPLALIYAGAHGPANGLEQVLDAAEILKNRAEIRFILVGDGPSKAALRHDAHARGLTNIEFLEPVGKQALLELLRKSDAGLMILRDAPLFSFGVSPNKLFEYLAAALPVVCNVPGEVAEMLQRSGAGIQVPSTGGRALAAGIIALTSLSPSERERKGRAGRGWVEREHSREALGARLNEVLRVLLQ